MQSSELNLKSGVTWKAVLTTICLMPFSFYWIIAGEIGLVGYALNTYAVPFYNVVFTLFLLMGLNFLCKKISGRVCFSGQELLTIYILLSVACALPSITLMTFLVTTVGHAFWFDSPENEWLVLFWDALPSWLTVQDKSILSGYYLGESTFYTTSHFFAWLRPALFWSGFMVLLMGMMLCFNIILRRQWVEHERLAYPIAQLPFQLLGQTQTLLTNPIVWIGFVISAVICLLNGLSFLLPSLPEIPIKRFGGWQGFGHIFIEKPLSHSFEGVEKLEKMVSKNKIITQIGCNLRFNPCLIKIKKILSEKKIGRIISFQAENGSYLPEWHANEDYRKSYAAKKEKGGSIILTSIHEIDYLYWFFGEVSEIFANIGKYSNLKITSDDHSSIFLKFKNGIIGEIHLDYY